MQYINIPPYKKTLLWCLYCLLSSVPFFSFAQIPTQGATISLTTEPAFPSPESQVTVSIEDYTVNTQGMTFEWSIDGEKDPALTNARSIPVPTKKIGQKTIVQVSLTRNGEVVFSSSIEIIPRSVELIIESDTYVPDFYQGRALPSSYSKIRALVIVDDGKSTPLSTFTYTWSLDSEILLGGPVYGKNTLDIIASPFNDQLLGIKVQNPDGFVIGEKFMYIKKIEPRMLFYEYSPLRGLTEHSITGNLPLIGEEVTVYGEPYFFRTSISQKDADLTFKIDGTPVNTASSIAPNAVTLRRVGEQGNARITLEATSKESLPQVVRGVFEVFFE